MGLGAEAEEARETKPITLIQKAVMDHLFELVFTVVEKKVFGHLVAL